MNVFRNKIQIETEIKRRSYGKRIKKKSKKKTQEEVWRKTRKSNKFKFKYSSFAEKNILIVKFSTDCLDISKTLIIFLDFLPFIEFTKNYFFEKCQLFHSNSTNI